MDEKVFISYRYRVGMIKGIEDFNVNLRDEYQVYEKPKWLPAAGGNYEMWFDFFINSPILSFIGGAIVGGVIYDFAKSYVFKPFWDALTSLNNINEGNLEVQTYRFNFEDVTICVYGVFTNYTSIFGAIFNEIYKQIPFLQKQELTRDLYEIHMPVNEENGQIDIWEGPQDSNEYLNCWRIDTDYGVMHYLYFLKEKKNVEF